MNITMPTIFDLDYAVDFTCFLDKLTYDNEYIYDYTNMGTVEPFGMLLISSKLRQFYKKHNGSKHFVVGHNGNGYASHMGYFQSAMIDYGKKPGEASGSNRYIPLTDVDIKDSYKVALFEKGMCIEEYIEKEIATRLVNVVSTESEKLKETLIFCITEIIRNVYDHSKSERLWFAAQYWPTKDLVEIAILDEGQGITSTLSRNKKFVIQDDDDAIRLSLKPGVTKSLDNKKSSDIYSNQGFGLYMTSKICEIAGCFSICSGDTCLSIGCDETISKRASFNGTAIRLRLHPSKIRDIDFEKIREEGNKLAKKLSDNDSIRVESYI
ncbi:hypothetical protein [Clostridium paraputrificum]|jgi:hypothetical protein|uniref:hypothetical protein n=1 Tax=Clostridium paraputrificum TaxID=29363 RepID=UPI000C083114|nr:hypothetical protein [Clostridium paraputrificum]MBS7132264.1 hypothetical protein [Clostridium sp.]MDB2087577.1 hypothetical protein [Clostridium paraputrificum]